MKKIFFALFAFQFIVQDVSAQKNELLVNNGNKGMYIEHKVVAKESFYSIGRHYNISPKSLSTFNKLEFNKGLLIDQKIRIPLTDSNFSQKAKGGTPVYYKVKSKDNLTKVSANNKNVSLSKLRLWNNLSGDKINEGAKLVVGFLISNEIASSAMNDKPVITEPAKITEEKPVEKAGEKPVITIEKKVEEKKEERVVAGDQGYYKPSFEQQTKAYPAIKNETVTAGIFKTASGWQDSKYYLLIDDVQPGTIVKIINPENNKAVYAKVLGEMRGIRQNEGLNIRLSNAAAEFLQIMEQDKFIVKINY